MYVVTSLEIITPQFGVVAFSDGKEYHFTRCGDCFSFKAYRWFRSPKRAAALRAYLAESDE